MLGYAKLTKPLYVNTFKGVLEVPIGTIVKLLQKKQTQVDYDIHVSLDILMQSKSYIEHIWFTTVNISSLELIGNCIIDK